MKIKLLKKVRKRYDIYYTNVRVHNVSAARYSVYYKGVLLKNYWGLPNYYYDIDVARQAIIDHVADQFGCKRKINKGKKIWYNDDN